MCVYARINTLQACKRDVELKYILNLRIESLQYHLKLYITINNECH